QNHRQTPKDPRRLGKLSLSSKSSHAPARKPPLNDLTVFVRNQSFPYLNGKKTFILACSVLDRKRIQNFSSRLAVAEPLLQGSRRQEGRIIGMKLRLSTQFLKLFGVA
ncbi:MAG: hypothetical protein WBE39_08525, partial [Candidatus Competibacter sp.]